MKKKLFSIILALSMVMAVFVPVMAEGGKSSPVTKPATIEKQETTVGNTTITITSDTTQTSGAVITFKTNTSFSDNTAAAKAKAVSEVSSYSYVTVFDLSANEAAKTALNGNSISITVNVDGAKKGDTYKAVHVKDDGTTEVLGCTVGADGKVTINGIKSFSPFILVKATSTNSGSKYYDAKDKNQDGVITCDEEMGSSNWIWSESKGACVYSVTNTSAR